MKKLFVLPVIALAISFASCGGNTTKNEGGSTTEQTTPEAPSETVPGIENVEVSNTVALEASDAMKFDKNLFRVKAGQAVELTLKNAGSMPKESMGHNVVVLKPGTDLATFGGEAAGAKADDYVPKSALSSVVAHTKLLGPGETDKITFTLEKGTYDFICSFPGHYGVMQGKIVAE
ncbi:azurin [Sphingobacterium sp. SRCM116780]|uniref:plastocyanin/azurin family copper-binding protein n=1 Tax=Sphingobacterium sp. SRCM116780 TaxID=2907623 RepID=UPI001F40BD7F|nr:azurin [Sphingobacterium sp. SRCM116780]UIR55189.1 azurin [Sphingobacterium sp. SRCM116780]